LAEIKENFFRAKPEPVTTSLIQWMNDPVYRAHFGMWCHQNFDALVDEYKTHGRFLTLKEIENNPIEYSDLP
jgi:hypothetical protein